MGGIIDYFGEHFDAKTGFVAMFYASAATAFCIGVVYALVAGRTIDNDGKHETAPSAAAASPDSGDEDESAGTESVTAPFPHLGRSA